MNYKEEELEEIYQKAGQKQLKNYELLSIKKQLYLICPIFKFSPDGLIELISTLYNLPNIKLIDEKFIYFLQKFFEYNQNIEKDFYTCSELLQVLYADYNTFESENDLDYLKSSLANLYSFNQEILKTIEPINNHLSLLLKNSTTFLSKEPSLDLGISYTLTIIEIFSILNITFLCNPEYYNLDYQLPSKITVYLDNNALNFEELFHLYLKTNDKKLFIKVLLDFYIENKSNIINIEEYKIKSLIKKTGFYLYKKK